MFLHSCSFFLFLVLIRPPGDPVTFSHGLYSHNGITQSNDCHPNPGPTYRFPCGECEKTCKYNQNAVACESCDTWFHTKCLKMSDVVFKGLQDTSWTCVSCGLPNFSTSLFTSISADSINTSVATDNTYSTQGSQRHHSYPSSSHADSNTSFCSVLSSPGLPQFTSSPVRKTSSIPLQLSSFRILVIKFQSMRVKRSEFWLLLQEANPDIIIGCETWLHQGFHEREVFPAGFHFVARRDRPNNHYGGVMIAAKDNIVATELSIDTTVEFCAASFVCPGKQSLIMGSLYRPPSSDHCYMEELGRVIRNIHRDNPDATLWIAGDANLPDIDWATNAIVGNTYANKIRQIPLLILAANNV